MEQPDFERARKYILTKLERELSPNLFYHGAHHTRDDVLPAAEHLATLAGVNGEDFLLLRTAALFHDVGYLEEYYANEHIGARMAARTLPAFGYEGRQIALVKEIVLATRMPQSPKNLLAELLCDADLDSLGRVEFFMVSHSLRLETMAYGTTTTVREWYKGQLEFLQNHRYFTAAARSLRESGKQHNMAEIRRLLGCGEQ